MKKAYGKAQSEIFNELQHGGACLDCGAGEGNKFGLLKNKLGFNLKNYYGIEWHPETVKTANKKGMPIIHGDLNQPLQFNDKQFKCIFGLSVLEHLLNPCKFLKECHRCLDDDGTLIILTPNISTFFTIALLLFGKMPSSGPHPDSDAFLKSEELFKVSNDELQHDTQSDTPVHRHLVVFSYRALKAYLTMLGFREIKGYGFGLYPFPKFMQPILERADPYHCHQMVFIARK